MMECTTVGVRGSEGKPGHNRSSGNRNDKALVRNWRKRASSIAMALIFFRRNEARYLGLSSLSFQGMGVDNYLPSEVLRPEPENGRG